MKFRLLLLGFILSLISPVTFSSEIWWIVEGYGGSCTDSVGENSGKTPENLINEFGCSVLKEEMNLVILQCPEEDGTAEEQQYVFSQSETTCKLFAKVLANGL